MDCILMFIVIIFCLGLFILSTWAFWVTATLLDLKEFLRAQNELNKIWRNKK